MYTCMYTCMYAILTSKPGQFRTEMGEGMQAVETWDYSLAGRKRAEFVIASFTAGLRTKVKVSDEAAATGVTAVASAAAVGAVAPVSTATTVNWVPSKFLETFDTLDEARTALHKLAHFGSIDIALVKR